MVAVGDVGVGGDGVDADRCTSVDERITHFRQLLELHPDKLVGVKPKVLLDTLVARVEATGGAEDDEDVVHVNLAFVEEGNRVADAEEIRFDGLTLLHCTLV